VLPGAYNAYVRCEAGYAISVLMGARDLLVNPSVVIAPGAVPAQIEIQAKAGGGVLSGELAVDPVPPNAGVLLVPRFNSTGPVMLPVLKEFRQFFLPPGDYSVYAFQDWQQVEYRNPAVLQSLAGGIDVRVRDGEEQKISIGRFVK